MDKQKKEKKLNARQKKFCLLRASGMKQIDAYKKAGYEGDRRSASGLESKEEVSGQIKSIQDRQTENVIDLARSCQELAPSALLELTELLKHKKAPQVQIRAIQEVFDRGFGKPRETIDTGVTIVWDIGTKRIE